MASTVLTGKDLKKHFGGVFALDGMGFHLDKGEILGLFGPNGAGKTTLFNAITGTIDVDEGTVEYRGNDITGLSPDEVCRRGVVKTNQIPRPFEQLKIRDNLKVAALYGGNLSSEEADEAVDETLEFTGLEEKGEEYPGAVGYLDLKRLEVGKALVTQPDVLLVDEPVSGLVMDEIDEMVDIIKGINEKSISIIWIEHIIEFISEVCERTIVIHEGKILAEGKPTEVCKDKKVVEVYLGETVASKIG